SVTVSDSTGCVATDDITVTIQPNFNASIQVVDSVDLYEPTQFFDQSTGGITSWSWTFGDGNTSSMQNPMHTYQALGTYEVCMTATQGVCTNTVCDSIKVGIFVINNLEEELGLELEVFPNPNQGSFQLKVQTSQTHDIQIELYDLSGKVMMERRPGKLRQYQEEIHLPELSAGVYLLKVQLDGQAVYRKVLIE
ncbi:MAG: PKD domain-containing protein, partial [Bacteroidota bacterium]